MPHMFLYYFDAHPSASMNSNEHSIIPPPTTQQQEEWNRAIQTGYGGKKPRHEKRSHFNFFPTSAAAPTIADTLDSDHAAAYGSTAAVAAGGLASIPDESAIESGGPQHPAGIIDLECYTEMHRSAKNPRVMELAGDDDLNPDLRAFYFCASDDGDDWVQAMLQNRHAALMDECDAYKQVCDGFSQQLQVLHQDLDECQVNLEGAQQELYRVRSQHEDVRRNCWRLAEDAFFLEEMESHHPITQQCRADLKLKMERIRLQDMGVMALVQLLTEYAQGLERTTRELHRENNELRSELERAGQSDQRAVQELQERLQRMEQEHVTQTAQWKAQNDQLQNQLHEARKELDIVQKALSQSKVEMTMRASQQRNTVKELQTHKKILKKEVLDLRQANEKLQRELSETKLQQQQEAMKVEQESQKNALLERYVEKMESQVKVQQNMMEMMSQSGSVYGGGSVCYDVPDTRQFPEDTPRRFRPPPRAPERAPPDEDDEDRPMIVLPRRGPRRGGCGQNPPEDLDNKSHVSELTEDRTQRHFDSIQMYERRRPSPRHGPPSFIIGVNNNTTSATDRPSDDDDIMEDDDPASRHLETIAGSAASLPPTPVHNRPNLPRIGSVGSVKSEKKLSVAQRARLEADRKTTPVRARLDDKTIKAELEKQQKQPQPQSQSSPQTSASSLWRRVEEVVLGPRSDEDDDEDSDSGTGSYASSSFRSTRVTDYTAEEEKKTEASLVRSTSPMCCSFVPFGLSNMIVLFIVLINAITSGLPVVHVIATRTIAPPAC